MSIDNQLITVHTPQGDVQIDFVTAWNAEGEGKNIITGEEKALDWFLQNQFLNRGGAPINVNYCSEWVLFNCLEHSGCSMDVPETLAADFADMEKELAEANERTNKVLSEAFGDKPKQMPSEILDSASWADFDGLAQVGTAILDSVAIDGAQAIARLTDKVTLLQGQNILSMGMMAKINHAANLAEATRQLAMRSRVPLVTIQNRDRTTSASAAQIQAIAESLSFDFLGGSNSPLTGAPIVFSDYDTFQNTRGTCALGSSDVVTMPSTGRQVVITYAVVPSDAVLPSHNHLGNPVAGYDASEAPYQLRAVAGNGRAAAIKYAYAIGNQAASLYYSDLPAQLPPLGIDAEEAESILSPMLVRLMSYEDLTANIGEETNLPA